MNKNIFQGNITNVNSVAIGDKIIIEKSPLPKSLTVNIPRTSRDRIIGRDVELDDLHQRLFGNRQVVLVNGMGGIGKTTLAQVYLDQYWDEYKHIAWISQLSEDLINDFINAEGLVNNLGIQTAGKDTKELFLNIMNEMNRIADGPNLLIIDNVDNPLSRLANYLPHQPQWHILATSRIQIDKFDLKELDFLSENEAVDLFLKYYNHNDITISEIKEVVRAVDLHTLTIEILAKTAQKQRSTISQLKKAITNDLKANVTVAHKGDKIDKISSYLASIFSMSKLSEDEVWLLKQFTCLPAVFHEYGLIRELISSPAKVSDDLFSEAIEDLCEKGWLLKRQEHDSYKMHLIIAQVIKIQATILLVDILNLMHSITLRLGLDNTKDNPIDKFPWIPYGHALLANFPDCNDEEIAILQNNLGMRLQEVGDYQGAKSLLERVMYLNEKIFGAEHPHTLDSYVNLASVLQDLGDYQAAKELLEKAMHFTEKAFGVENPKTAEIYSNLASVLQDLGDYEKARSLLEKAIRSDEKYYGPEHPTTAERYSTLALVFKDIGDYQEAQNLLEKALRCAENNFGPDHPTTSMRLSNLALVLQDLGDYNEAKLLLEKVMHSNEKNFGNDHPNTAVSYSNLATVLQEFGDFKGAKILLEKATHSAEKNFGNEHPKTAISYSNLALVLEALGDYQEALKFSKKALEIFRRKLPNEHRYIRITSDIYRRIDRRITL